MIKYLILLSAVLSFNVNAQSSPDDLALADEAIQAPTMDIEGQYQVKEEVKAEVKAAPVKAAVVPQKRVERRVVSQSDRLKMYRERLEELNKVMIEKKMEQIRLQQEVALFRKLEQSMNQTLKAIDSVKN